MAKINYVTFLLTLTAGKDGFRRQEYIDCLEYLWEQLDNPNEGVYDICLPILGSGITKIDGTNESFSSYDLLKMIVCSYILSPYKLIHKCKLRIIYRREDIDINEWAEKMSFK